MPKPMKATPATWSKRRRTVGRLNSPAAPRTTSTRAVNQMMPSALWISAMLIVASSGLTPCGMKPGRIDR